MPFKIVRNDITKMNTQAIVNTANKYATVGTGCDSAIYNAAGYDELLAYRKENIGDVPEGEVFITPGFNLNAEYIIHAVSPLYVNGNEFEDEKLHLCYRKSLTLAAEYSIESIAFPLISTGGFGYPKEEGLRIAIDEINAFLLNHNMMIYLVVFDDKTTALGGRIYPDLEEYIDLNYVVKKIKQEYDDFTVDDRNLSYSSFSNRNPFHFGAGEKRQGFSSIFKKSSKNSSKSSSDWSESFDEAKACKPDSIEEFDKYDEYNDFEEIAEYGISDNEEILADVAEEPPAYIPFDEKYENKLAERMQHLTDTFSEYLLYLIQDKNMQNADVYKRAIVDKKTFSKIKNNKDYHPQKLTALCLCVGAKLNLDESKDLLARAGYALSPCDKTDIIFSFFIENEIYDMLELDIQLEEHGLPCIIS
jgi:O-acetyl-ADP-ribose deacetylase (regulator of RNase III)